MVRGGFGVWLEGDLGLSERYTFGGEF